MKSKLPPLLVLAVAVNAFSNAAPTSHSAIFVPHNQSIFASQRTVYENSIPKDQLADHHSNYHVSEHDVSIGSRQNFSDNPVQRVRLRFLAEDGLNRPLLLGFTPDDAATDGVDYGYDASNPDQYPNDMFWNIDGGNYVIQGVGAFETWKTYPLNINITNAGLIKIDLNGLENFDSEIDVFIYDAILNTTTQINSDAFEIILESGIYQNRFFIAFSSDNMLSVRDNDPTSVQVSYLTRSHEIYIKSIALNAIEKIDLFNMAGQSIVSWNKKQFISVNGEIRIPIENIPEGSYIIKAESHNATINKKAIITF